MLGRRKFPAIGTRKIREGGDRDAPAKRGYDHIWSALSTRFRRKNPFCRFCDQEGRDAVPADVVDHIVPVTDGPNLRLTWSNLQSLCSVHHNGVKRRLEEIARKHDAIDRLPEWCANPGSRPKRMR